MSFGVIQQVLGYLIMTFSLSMLPPMVVSVWYEDGELIHFLWAFALMLTAGLLLWLPAKGQDAELRVRDGFLIVTLFWTVLGMLSALPFMLGPHLSFVDSFFESVSGFTTTGATVLTQLDSLPRSVLYYRQQLQWLGGMGIIVLAVAIFPMLGVGGMQLYRAETPGPMKSDKLTPRIMHTARALWLIYLALTLACAVSYWLAGMTPFDAVGHSFSTIATGGFSTHDAGMAYFDSSLIEWTAVLFMLLGGINFAVHFVAWRQRSVLVYLRDTEALTYLIIAGAVAVLVTLVLLVSSRYQDVVVAFRHSVFQVVSMMTTTGFLTADFSSWPLFVPILIMIITFVGGCAGSTAGGMKVIRILLLYKQGMREVARLVHPSAVIPVKVGGKQLPEKVIEAVWGFFSLYILSTLVLSLAVMGTGLDAVSSFSAVAACINVTGPGLGSVAFSFAGVPMLGKVILTFAMLLGRLEVFTLLVLLTPAFWRK